MSQVTGVSPAIAGDYVRAGALQRLQSAAGCSHDSDTELLRLLAENESSFSR